MTDIWIVGKKELKELLVAYGGRRGWLLQMIIFIGMFGLLLPLSQKELWMRGWMPAIFFPCMPLFVANWVVADSFAGERERKTLETLLATRLPDRAIFLGKVLAALIYAWTFTVFSLVTSLIGLNLVKGTPGLYLYPPLVLLAGLVGPLLTGLLIIGLGVFISLRAKSVRAAQQTLGLPMFLLFFGIGFGLPALAEALPEGIRQDLLRWLAATDPAVAGVGLLLVLIGADVALLTLAVRHFRRTRLILE